MLRGVGDALNSIYRRLRACQPINNAMATISTQNARFARSPTATSSQALAALALTIRNAKTTAMAVNGTAYVCVVLEKLSKWSQLKWDALPPRETVPHGNVSPGTIGDT
jgi:hypothetical protein